MTNQTIELNGSTFRIGEQFEKGLDLEEQLTNISAVTPLLIQSVKIINLNAQPIAIGLSFANRSAQLSINEKECQFKHQYGRYEIPSNVGLIVATSDALMDGNQLNIEITHTGDVRLYLRGYHLYEVIEQKEEEA